MKNRSITMLLSYVICCSVIACSTVWAPMHARAADAPISPIVITELSAGTTESASQEFIELYNQSSLTIDLTAQKWQVQIATSKATSWDKSKTVMLTGLFYPGTYLLLSSSYAASGESKSYLQEYATAQFTPGITSASGHIRVVQADDGLYHASDTLEWSTKSNDGELTSAGIDGLPIYKLDAALAPGKSIKHALAQDNSFLFSSNIQQNFLVSSCPTPTANNVASTSSTHDLTEPLSTTIDIDDPACATDDTDETGGQDDSSQNDPDVLLPDETASKSTNAGLALPQLSELLPNPGPPLRDDADEFIELYNPNDAEYDLSGLTLDIGLTGSKHYVFPASTVLGAHQYQAFFSKETHISLSNSGGKVVLRNTNGQIISQSDSYGAAKENVAWALRDGLWQWTAKPTPYTENEFIVPTIKKAVAKTAVAKAAKTSTKKKTAKPKASKKTAAKDFATVKSVEQRSPLHPLALAVVGGFALLYGGYEYRHDVANKFHKLRNNRTARRKNR